MVPFSCGWMSQVSEPAGFYCSMNVSALPFKIRIKQKGRFRAI